MSAMIQRSIEWKTWEREPKATICGMNHADLAGWATGDGQVRVRYFRVLLSSQMKTNSMTIYLYKKLEVRNFGCFYYKEMLNN